VNLFLLGVSKHIAADPSSPAARAMSDALRRVVDAVQASGFEHSELWSYEIANGRLRAVRYGISSDLQLWSTADLAVQYALSKLPRSAR
jgi:hypothetical protein